MDYIRTRRSSNTNMAIAAIGIGALVAYALSSPRRRAAIVAAGQSALETGSRLAADSVDRLQHLVPAGALATASDFGATARDASSRATAAAAGTLHEAVDRASDVMRDLLARARDLSGPATHKTREIEHEIAADAEHAAAMASALPGRNALIAAAALGAAYYAMRRYGVVDRVREKAAQATGADASGTLTHDKSLFIDAPVEQVFDTWSNYENFPRFMSNVESVQPLDGMRSHWKVKGPAGIPVEWDAVTHLNRPNEIAWESEPGSTVQNEGRVTLVPEGTGTRVTVHLSYRPPAGVLGHAVSALFGANPKQEFEEDLQRMKQYIEGRAVRTPASSGAVPIQSV